MHIEDFDLNLLHVFQAVYAAGSVSRAAERLQLSQPAVSHALARLRRSLGDPLFVRATGGVAATPRAERFARQCAVALGLLGDAIRESEHFEPASSQRRFAVHMSDIGADEFLPQLMAALRPQAPGVQIEAVQLDPPAIGPALESGRIDMAFGYLPGLTGTEHAPLLAEHYVVLLRRGHPLARELSGRSALHRLDFILVASHSEPARALHLAGLESRIRLTLPHFTVAPSILEASDLAVVMPSRPARRFAARHALQVVEADLGLPPFTVSIHWLWRMNADPGHRWLRALAQAMRFDASPAPGRGIGAPRRAPRRRALPIPP